MNSSVTCETRDESPIVAYFLKVRAVLTPVQWMAFGSTKLPLPAVRPCPTRRQPLGYLTIARKLHRTQVKYRLSYLHLTSTKKVI